jgi:prevent-host-death family protein
MKNVSIREAKTNFSKLLERVAAGEEITIAKSGVPIARLSAIKSSGARNFLGIDRERLKVPPDFDAPLPPEILAGFLGGEVPKTIKKPRRNRKK